MKTTNFCSVAVILLISFACPAVCAVTQNACEITKMNQIANVDFEDGRLDLWRATDPNAWRIEDANGTKVLSLFTKSQYKPKVRSPLNINTYQAVSVGSFTVELNMKSTREYNPKRDLCVFFGYQDPNHFYYAHIADKSDEVHNQIYIVNDAPRTSITKTRNEGNSWDGGWHRVKVVRDVDRGTIEVFFDDMEKPVMTAVDKTLTYGKIGVGSFDDTGQFDNIKLWGKKRN